MKLTIRKSTGLYILLVLAIGNASLRLGSDGMSSFFRLLSPLFAILIFARRYKKLSSSLLVLLSGTVYSIFVSMIGYGTISYEYLVFVDYIYIVYIVVFEIKNIEANFEVAFWNFLHYITVITLVLAFIQYFVRIPYPYVELPAEHGMNLFMSNENELGEPLGFMSLIYLYKVLFENKRKYIPMIALIILIEFINDAKLTILGCVLGFVILFYLKFGRTIKMSVKFAVLAGMMFLIVVICGIYIFNPTVKFRDYSISVRELLFDSMGDIIHLRTMAGTGGSTVDRTNAIIYGLKELINSKFLGIGWGNSVIMLSKSQYRLLTAKSMHNIVIQFLCEMGIFALGVYYCFVKWIMQHVNDLYKDKKNILKLVFIVSFIIISAQSSIGILSNYYSWIVIFFVALCSDEHDYNLKTIERKKSEIYE